MLSLVTIYFIYVKQSCTFSTPFGPPNNKPGSFIILLRLSHISIGIKEKTPMKVKSKTLINLAKIFVFLKFYGSKSPWANFIPMIQLYYAMKVAASDKKQTVRAN